MSAKTSTQPGRRTPLSLSGTVTKTHPNKGGGNAAHSSGNNANGHSTSNTNNKMQQSKTEPQQTVNNSDIKENPNKKQQQADKKQQQNDNNKKPNEKNQNGVNSNKQQANENKQQQNKDKQMQQNSNDNKLNEKEKKEKPEKSNKSDKLEKHQENVEKEETKPKEDKKPEQDKADIKKDENKPKEVNEAKEDKKEAVAKSDEKTELQQQVKNDDKKSKEETQIKNFDRKPEEEHVDNMEIVEEQQPQQKSPPVTPKTNSKSNKTSTPVNKTPTKASEKTPQKSTPSNSAIKTTPVTKREVTSTIDDNDDIEMEPLAIESSPIKTSETGEVAHINIAPSATSTPGKILLPKRNAAVPKSDVQLAMQSGLSPERPRAFSQISGRKSIRPISDYTPSKFQTNSQFRESYRRINTELDVTNSSMNVTVGSEVPNNLSFSFFGRGRKRERTPPQHSQSAIGELQTDMEISPPKRARLDMHGFFSAVASPLSLLRNRFSKATLQSSTPVKLQQKLKEAEDEIEVQNVSGVSVHEEIAKSDKEHSETSTTSNDDTDATLGEEAKETKIKTDIVTPTSDQGDSKDKEFTDVSLKREKTCGMEQTCEQSDIKITETPLQPAVGDPMAKNKRCVVM
ncbi:neurofilament heavy polypeptide [Calliphora vicina]|uniref:neurofilament heavy polypeptide n=1 Tax=Calliphora vicina TaxID=7373 RepID=UPI00325C1971